MEILYTSQLNQRQNIFHQIWVTYEISNLATKVWVRCWGKATPGELG